MKADVVDAQLHVTHAGWENELAVMDALGISVTILDEFWGYDDRQRTLPFATLSNGWFRPVSPHAQAAALRQPDRFAWIQRIERRDSDVLALLAVLAESPGCVGVRVDLREEAELRQFADGGYDQLLQQAESYRLPVSVLSRQGAQAIDKVAGRLPQVRLLVDHCGHPASAEEWNDVLALGAHGNVWLKWCLAETVFKDSAFPYPNAQAQLRRAADHFGVERIVWASNATVARPKGSLSQLLQAILTAPGFSTSDREWLVGGSSRSLYPRLS